MKKRILGLTVLALSALSLASCGGSNSSTTIDKGSSVDSITFKNNKNEDVTIKKTDTYQEMISKLDSLQFGVVRNDNGYLPYKEEYETSNARESTNTVCFEAVKDDKGSVDFNYDKYTKGKVNLYSSRTINEKIYEYGEDSLFSIGDQTRILNDCYDLVTGKVEEKKNVLDKDQGLYIKYTGSVNDGGSIEIATTSLDNAYKLYGNNDPIVDISKDHKATYFTSDFNAYNEEGNYQDLMYSTYKSSSKNIVFRTNNIPSCTTLATDVNYGNIQPAATIIDYDRIPDYLKNYHELSFELTDKYLVIKNKINTSNNLISFYEQTEFEELVDLYEGSYVYNEVWLDYNNIAKINDYYYLGYAYYKYDQVDIYKDDLLYTEDNAYYDKEVLEELDLIGKTSNRKQTNEIHLEVSLLDISKDEINNKKNEFINKCKNNNFLTEYNFSKVE